MVAGAIAVLVEEGSLSWDTPIREILPEFIQRKDKIGQLNRRPINSTGLFLINVFLAQQERECLVPKDEVVRACCFLEPVKRFRKAFTYTNWNYRLASKGL